MNDVTWQDGLDSVNQEEGSITCGYVRSSAYDPQNNRQFFRKNDLIAWIADDPKSGDKFLAVFNAQDQIKIDENKALWKSENITNDLPSQSVTFDLDIAGAKKLYLAVSNISDEFSRHHADWIEPVLYGIKDTLKLTDLKWENATSGRANPILNKSVSLSLIHI